VTAAASADAGVPRGIRVAFDRLPGWLDRYEVRHPGVVWSWADGSVVGRSPDGACARIAIPYGRVRVRAEPRQDLDWYLRQPWLLGVLVVRRGGFAVALARGPEVVDRKVGRRHVQGRSKAGGWSQQRFARRRDNQAREAFAAAADHAARILAADVAYRLDALAVGGDRSALHHVLTDPRLEPLAEVVQITVGGVGDPRPDTVQRVLARVRSVQVALEDPAAQPPGAGP
jgi:Actinobacteria/chloroflexi VLRF1 release factor